MVSSRPRRRRERVVDAVGLGDRAPARGVAVVLVGDRLQRVAVGDRVDLQAARSRGVVGFWPALGLLGLRELEVDERADRLAVGPEHHEADGQRAADHLRALDRAPLEGHERRRRAAAAPAARLHHLQQLDRVVLDRRVGALQRRVEQELDADRPRHAAAELGFGVSVPVTGLIVQTLVLVIEYSCGLNAHSIGSPPSIDQLRALEVLRDRHRRQPIFSPEWAISRDFRGHVAAGGRDRGAASSLTGKASANVHERASAPSWVCSSTRDLLELRLARGSSRTTSAARRRRSARRRERRYG